MSWVRRGSIGFVVLIVLGAIIALWLLKAPIMSSYLSKKMGVDVSILGITMRPSAAKIYRFKISNPMRFKSRTAFSAKEIFMQYTFGQLFATPTVIDLIELNEIFLGIEFSNPLGTQNNWTAIAAKMPERKSKGEGVLIRKLVLNDIDIEIKGMGLDAITGSTQKKHIARLEFNNINSNEGFPTEQLIQAVFGSAGLKDYIKNLFSPSNTIKDAVQPFFKLFGQQNEETDPAFKE